VKMFSEFESFIPSTDKLLKVFVLWTCFKKLCNELGSKIHSHRYCDRKSQGIVELKPTGRTDGNQVTCAANSSNKLKQVSF